MVVSSINAKHTGTPKSILNLNCVSTPSSKAGITPSYNAPYQHSICWGLILARLPLRPTDLSSLGHSVPFSRWLSLAPTGLAFPQPVAVGSSPAVSPC